MNLQEIESRVEALNASLKIDAVDAIYEDSFALGMFGKQIQHEIAGHEGCFAYARPSSKVRISAIVSRLVVEYACGSIK